MYASYLNFHRKEGAPPVEITDFVLGYPTEETDTHIDDLLRRPDW